MGEESTSHNVGWLLVEKYDAIPLEKIGARSLNCAACYRLWKFSTNERCGTRTCNCFTYEFGGAIGQRNDERAVVLLMLSGLLCRLSLGYGPVRPVRTQYPLRTN